ncbi:MULTISPECIES: FxsA family protein [unclassified Thioalkalivibrio]|uniref:FxsA family protein n=1 Tax=unclassified Thioalkalivibrio TaxID=2621013 RepID=UPI00035C7D9C|nr:MULTISPECIES: FxsA family protein [unclassified Thioalkalivibrio]
MRNPLFPLFVFLGLVLLEIFGFAWVGDAVGALMTVALVIITAAAGLLLFRLQGFYHWRRLQQSLARGEVPARGLVEGWLLMSAAVLLLLPGFFTDAAGFVLLIPPLRRWAADGILRRGMVRARGAGPGGAQGSDTIEGEFRRHEDGGEPPDDRLDHDDRR